MDDLSHWYFAITRDKEHSKDIVFYLAEPLGEEPRYEAAHRYAEKILGQLVFVYPFEASSKFYQRDRMHWARDVFTSIEGYYEILPGIR